MLSVADEFDVQSQFIPTVERAGFVEDTIGRSPAAPFTPITPRRRRRPRAGHLRCVASRTSFRRPRIRRCLHAEHLDEVSDMMMVTITCRRRPEDVRSPIPHASETIAAEDVLHDLGALSMMSSDSQAMGRIGEVICRTWQTADKMKRQRGRCPARRPAATTSASAATSRSTRSTRRSRTASRARSLDRGRQAGGSRALEAGVLRRQAGAGDQGRLVAGAMMATATRRFRRPSQSSRGRCRGVRRRAASLQRPLRQPAGIHSARWPD